MKTVTRQAGLFLPWLWLSILAPEASGLSRPALPRFQAVDLKKDFTTDEQAMFARPVHLAFLNDRVSVVDAEEAVVSVFDAQGRFIARAGGKGQGPGQLDFPTAAWPDVGGLIVCDGRNRRIVSFDARGGESGSFRLTFFPAAVLLLAGDRVLVARNPGAGDQAATILSCYDWDGRPLWAALPPAVSNDRIADTMSNVVILLGGHAGEIFVVFRHRAAGIRRLSADGRDLGEIRLGREYPVRRVTKTVAPGNRLRAEVFCWHAAYSEGRFYLLAADWTEDRDLGPGSEVYVAGTDGQVQEVIELPERMTKIAASSERLYAIDLDYRLRVLKVERK